MSEAVRAALADDRRGRTLSVDEARLAMGAVMDGEATPAQLAALLMGLRMRGETVDELAGFATAMRERVLRGRGARRDDRRRRAPAATAAGRSTSRRPRRWSSRRPASRSPSTATGRSPRRPARPTSSMRSACDRPRRGVGGAGLRDNGFAFLFAPNFHPAMTHAGADPPRDRRADRVQPARPADQPGRTRRQLLGVGDRGRAPRIAEVAPAAGHRADVRHPRRRRRRAAARRQRRAVPRRPGRGRAPRHPVDAARARPHADGEVRRRRRGGERRDSSRRSPRRAGRGATSCCSTPGRRCSSAARSTRSRRDRQGGARRSTPGWRPSCSSGCGRSAAAAEAARRPAAGGDAGPA